MGVPLPRVRRDAVALEDQKRAEKRDRNADQANGTRLGQGIYNARWSEIWQGYAKQATKRYEQTVLAVRDVANNPTLRDHEWEWILQNERTFGMRFLLVNGGLRINLAEISITKVPKLMEVLDSHADEARQTKGEGKTGVSSIRMRMKDSENVSRDDSHPRKGWHN